jgi:hypothetical protein
VNVQEFAHIVGPHPNNFLVVEKPVSALNSQLEKGEEIHDFQAILLWQHECYALT